MFCIGQRYISEAEPELGLGFVAELSHKRVTIAFRETERTYSTEQPPIKRVLFRSGDSISLMNGQSFTVDSVREEDGINYYSCSSDEFPETLLSDTLSFTTPLDRFFKGLRDRTGDFDMRLDTLRKRSEIQSSPARGFCGGKIELLPHQLSVAESIASSQNRRYFLADEVGLGKTIEASLAIHRLLTTGQISRVLIVVPSALIHQWFVELFRRFSILGTIVNDEFRQRFNEADENIFEYESPVIVTIEDLAKDDALSKAVKAASWDMLVVDEAHHLRRDSAEYDSIQTLAHAVPGLLLLTASPEALDDRSFFSLLQLLDPHKYRSFESFTTERDQYRNVASLAETILSGEPLTTEQIDLLNASLNRTEAPEPNQMTREERETFVRTLVDVCGVGRAIFRNSRSVISGFPERTVNIHSIQENTAKTTIEQVTAWIDQFVAEQGEQKQLIICSTKEKMNRINRVLQKKKNRKIALFHEDMTIVQLDRNAAWFSDPEGASILIATEIGSEGRNFQYADNLILADLPNNPELLEQRIGRLDRIGRKQPVSIVVPVVENSFDHRLSQWYHHGLDAFCHTVPGAYQIGETFLQEVEQFHGDQVQWENLLERTASFRKELSLKIEQGRNRLLELASCDLKSAKQLKQEIETQETSETALFVERLFAHFGIAVDSLSKTLLYLDFETLTDHTFPVPLMCEEGMSVTFDRDTALAREDAIFLSIDHPMISGAMDLILGAETGNNALSLLPDSGESGFLLELIYVLAAPGGTNLFPERFLPDTVIRILVDDAGDDVSEIFEESFLRSRCEEGDISHLSISEEELEVQMRELIEECSGSVTTQRNSAVNEALAEASRHYVQEIERVAILADSSESEALQNEFRELTSLLEGASLRLDSVRVIALKE